MTFFKPIDFGAKVELGGGETSIKKFTIGANAQTTIAILTISDPQPIYSVTHFGGKGIGTIFCTGGKCCEHLTGKAGASAKMLVPIIEYTRVQGTLSYGPPFSFKYLAISDNLRNSLLDLHTQLQATTNNRGIQQGIDTVDLNIKGEQVGKSAYGAPAATLVLGREAMWRLDPTMYAEAVKFIDFYQKNIEKTVANHMDDATLVAKLTELAQRGEIDPSKGIIFELPQFTNPYAHLSAPQGVQAPPPPPMGMVAPPPLQAPPPPLSAQVAPPPLQAPPPPPMGMVAPPPLQAPVIETPVIETPAPSIVDTMPEFSINMGDEIDLSDIPF